jgi:hypothetical protein
MAVCAFEHIADNSKTAVKTSVFNIFLFGKVTKSFYGNISFMLVMGKIPYFRCIILLIMNTKRGDRRTTDGLMSRIFEPVSLYPVVALRLGFGAAMALWSLYMLVSGNAKDLFVEPEFYFSYPGFEWIQPLPDAFLYLIFVLLFVFSVFIFAGMYFRVASIAFTCLFAYLSLLDKASYLSYYYFALLLGFMLCISPAHRLFSIDLIRKPSLRADYVPSWLLLAFKVQVALVFIFAGMAKLNADWLFKGTPVDLWLTQLSLSGLPLPESLLSGLFPIALSWLLIMFDFIIPHFLLDKRTSAGAFILVLLMQLLAIIIFGAGFFPVLIAFSCLVFLPDNRIHSFLSRVAYFLYDVFDFRGEVFNPGGGILLQYRKRRLFPALLAVFFSLQIMLPVALFLNWGSSRWADSAFRFSWDIRLHEKTGQVVFLLHNDDDKSTRAVNLSDFLTEHQIRVMSEDPSMIRQFGEFLLRINPDTPGLRVSANATISLNGAPPVTLLEDSWDNTAEKSK